MSALAVGLMSGTSLDGVDAALVEIAGPNDLRLVAFHCRPYTAEERASIAGAIAGGTAADLAALHTTLGGWFGEVALTVATLGGVRPADLAFVASHGQTVWHVPRRATLQLGCAATIAERVGVKVVSDFRGRDVAAGGEGAPLVPMADAMLFAHPERPRVLLNLGGMANVTWVRRRGDLDGLVAFDTGPGVAVIDGVVRALDPNVDFDRDGERARRGRPVQSVVDECLQHAYFHRPPPKSTGRELFGPSYVDGLLERLVASEGSDDDAVATAVSLTVRSVADAVDRWIPSHEGTDVVVSGGGARNPALLDGLRETLGERRVVAFEDLFFDGDAKEAAAFAYLGWRTLEGLPGNVPSATGASGPRVLGSVTGLR